MKQNQKPRSLNVIDISAPKYVKKFYKKNITFISEIHGKKKGSHLRPKSLLHNFGPSFSRKACFKLEPLTTGLKCK